MPQRSYRKFWLVFVLICALQILGCDLTGGVAEVQKKAEIQVRQYFPDARAVVSPQQGTILVVTCTQGLGKPAITEIAKYLGNSRGIQRLQEARHLPVKLSPYRFFVLDFYNYYVRLDTDSKQYRILPTDPESQLRYKQVCGLPDATFTVNR
jgi:hypothetical protein